MRSYNDDNHDNCNHNHNTHNTHTTLQQKLFPKSPTGSPSRSPSQPPAVSRTLWQPVSCELPSGSSGGNPSLHVISLGTLCIWDPVGALAFAYQHLLGTEQGQETTTFVFRTVDIWHDLSVLGQESQETPMAQGHQICLQGRLTRLYTHQSSSSTTEASNAFWDDIMIHHHLMHPHANQDRFRMLSIAKVCKPHDCQSGSTYILDLSQVSSRFFSHDGVFWREKALQKGRLHSFWPLCQLAIFCHPPEVQNNGAVSNCLRVVA